MSPSNELRVFRAVVIAIILAIPITLGLLGGFGGLEGIAALLGTEAPGPVNPALRNHLRAICTTFAGFGLLAGWTLGALEERKTAFRLAVAVIVVAGLGRVTGWIVDGRPGLVASVFMAMELILFPLLLVWHTRLLRLAREPHHGAPRASE